MSTEQCSSAANAIVWPANKDSYSLDKKIGSGAFAEVFCGTCTTNGQQVAVKILDLGENSNLEDIQKEVSIMKSNDHCNIVSCHASFVVSRHLYLAMQLMDKGSCLYAMNKLKKINKEAGFKEEWIAIILRSSLEGLVYIHKRGKIHRDLKAGNILLNKAGEVKIADFGVSGAIDSVERGAKRTTFVGTPCWMAPEVMEQIDGYNEKADIWSLGITALELAKGHAPYAKDPPMKVLLKTLQDEPPSLSTYEDGAGNFSKDFKDFVKSCLQKDSSRRLDATKLLSSNLIKKAKLNTFLAEDMLQQVPDIWSDPQVAEKSVSPVITVVDQEYTPGTTWTFVDSKTSSQTSQPDFESLNSGEFHS